MLAPAVRGRHDAASRNLVFTFQLGTVQSISSCKLHFITSIWCTTPSTFPRLRTLSTQYEHNIPPTVTATVAVVVGLFYALPSAVSPLSHALHALLFNSPRRAAGQFKNKRTSLVSVRTMQTSGNWRREDQPIVGHFRGYFSLLC